MSTLFPPPSCLLNQCKSLQVVQVHICTEGMLKDFHFSHPDRLSKASGCSNYLEVTYVVFIDSWLLWHIFWLQVSEVVRKTDGVPQWKIHTLWTDTHMYSSSPFESIGFFMVYNFEIFFCATFHIRLHLNELALLLRKTVLVNYLQSCCVCLNRIIAVDFSDFR